VTAARTRTPHMISTSNARGHAATHLNIARRVPEWLLVGSICRELLDRTLIINQRHAANVLDEYQHHYNNHRPHRALGQAAPLRPLPQPTTSKPNTVQRRDRLGGLLREYQQVA
jgi:transposase InsO family protein